MYDLHHYDVSMRTSNSLSRVLKKDRSRSRSRSKSMKHSSGKSNSVNSSERRLYHKVIEQAEMEKNRLQRELESLKEKDGLKSARAKVLKDEANTETEERAKEKELEANRQEK